MTIPSPDLAEAIHCACFGYNLTKKQARLILEAYMLMSAELAYANNELRKARDDAAGQRVLVETLTAELEVLKAT